MPWTNSWSEFFAMGKHGAYVWASYGITAVLLIGLIVMVRLGMKRYKAELLQRIEQGQKTSSKASSKLVLNKHD